MPTVEERLGQVTPKVERAKQHISELEREIRAFLETNPYRVACNVDPETRKPVYYVFDVKPTPNVLPLIAGDAIQNLVTALDHLAYQLVCNDTQDNPPKPNRIYFPIEDDAAGYKKNRTAKIVGASQNTINAIDALQPYKGGNDSLWKLRRLNNLEKHRLLLTVGSCAAGVHLGQLIARAANEHFPPEAIEQFKAMPPYLVSADRGFPLTPGFELYIGAEGEQPDPDQKFRFNVAISEPGIVESESLLATVHQLAAVVDETISSLAPLLRESA